MMLHLLCALYSLPGPPQINFQNGTFQLYSINRRLCPNIDPKRDTIFELYTRSNPDTPQILLTGNEYSVRFSNINFQNPTIIFFHGFLESSQADDSVQIKNSYLNRGEYNVILGNNQRLLAGLDYLTAAKNCLPIGKFAAKFLDYLVTLGLDLKNLHIIGMSLGAQIAGFIGQYLQSGKAGRLTGLDPAGPLFIGKPPDQRLSPDDADFVDVVHTNAGFFGTTDQSGHVDIWFNGGTKQPGCKPWEIFVRNRISIMEQIFCNHYQAYRVYVNSILMPGIYTVTKCSGYNEFKFGFCDGNEQTFIGEETDRNARGNYYIKTGVTAVNI